MQQHKKIAHSTEQGFTLVELMVVVAIIAILAAIAVPKLTQFIKNADTASATENMGRIAQYMEGKQGIIGGASAGFVAGTTYYVVGTDFGSTPAGVSITRLIGVELEAGHKWAYLTLVAPSSDGKTLSGMCIKAIAKDATANYIQYSKRPVTTGANALYWEGNFWKLSYLSDGADLQGSTGGDCPTPSTGT